MLKWQCFKEFEQFLVTPSADSPWIAGMDFHFGMSLKFVENMGWPTRWADYIDQIVKPLDRKSWRIMLENYKRPRDYGDKEHRRATDKVAGSVSPPKLYGVPVGLMFFEGALRLREAGVTIPGLQYGSPERLVVEAYPGVAARHLVGKLSYKPESEGKKADAQLKVRKLILNELIEGKAVKVVRHSG